jgi:hypothetical protein
VTITSLALPDSLAVRLQREARRRGLSVSDVAEAAIAAYLDSETAGDPRSQGDEEVATESPAASARRELPFANVGSGPGDGVARRIEEILTAEWGRGPRNR